MTSSSSGFLSAESFRCHTVPSVGRFRTEPLLLPACPAFASAWCLGGLGRAPPEGNHFQSAAISPRAQHIASSLALRS
jgi:hypothetical protein